MERAVAAFARAPNGGLVVTTSPSTTLHRDLIITLAARHKLPAVYWQRYFVADGGLISYGLNIIDQYWQAGGYVDRILKGEKPADLPVQVPTKYETVINLKTAKALGLNPNSLFAESVIAEVQSAASVIGRHLEVFAIGDELRRPMTSDARHSPQFAVNIWQRFQMPTHREKGTAADTARRPTAPSCAAAGSRGTSFGC
jgi:ABC transporter substrate binding protein